jgi:hypothetical protein
MNRSKVRRWLRQRWFSLLVVAFLVLPILGFLLGSAAVLAYTYWPSNFSELTLPVVSSNARHVFVIAHGLHDTPASWADPLKHTLVQELADEGDHIQGIALDWHQYSNTTLRCSVNGKRIGHLLGAKMATSDRLESVHLIGHSCGSFVIFGLCSSLKEKRKEIQVQTTYLDPVSIYGGLLWNYGIEYFGSCADFSDAYIDHEDGVPGSNQLLPHTHTFDVTNVRKKSLYSQSPHVWPTHYYQQLVRSGNFPSLRKNANLLQLFPRGILRPVNELPQQDTTGHELTIQRSADQPSVSEPGHIQLVKPETE